MGDRANVCAVDDFGSEGRVYFYTHWGGDELPHVVQTALAKKLRWGDCSYLNRIIFREMIRGQEDEETGFGISASITDNEHHIVVLDHRDNTVGFAEVGKEPACFVKWTFDEYIALDREAIEKAYFGGATGRNVAVVIRRDSGDVVAVIELTGPFDPMKVHKAVAKRFNVPRDVLFSELVGTVLDEGLLDWN